MGGAGRVRAAVAEAAPEGRVVVAGDIGRFLPWKCLVPGCSAYAKNGVSRAYRASHLKLHR
jgi:hypothetical protein